MVESDFFFTQWWLRLDGQPFLVLWWLKRWLIKRFDGGKCDGLTSFGWYDVVSVVIFDGDDGGFLVDIH